MGFMAGGCRDYRARTEEKNVALDGLVRLCMGLVKHNHNT